MALTRQERILLHKKAQTPLTGVGAPSKLDGKDGDVAYRRLSGVGVVHYIKRNGEWQALSSTDKMPAERATIRVAGGTGASITDHGGMSGLGDDDHTQYLLVDGTRAVTGDLSLSGGDGALTFTVAGENSIKIPDNQASALIIEEANAAYLTFVTTNSGEKITLGKKLEAGSVEIEGTAFDINGGDISAATISGGLTWSAAQDLNNQNLTNVDIDSGSIDGTAIGASSHSTIKGTTIDATTDFTIDGLVITADDITNDAALEIQTAAGDITLDPGGNNVLPGSDNADDLGSSGQQWKDLYVHGIGYIDQLGTDGDAVAAYISSGELDGTVIGGESAAAITGTTIDAETDFTIGSLVITDDSIVMTPSTSDTVTIAGATNGVLNITTVDNAAAAANIVITADGTLDLNSVALDIDATGAVTIDGSSTISIDGADDMNFTITSSTGAEDLTIQQIGANDSSIIITAAGTGADAISIDATAGSMVIGASLVDQKTLTLGNTSSTYLKLSPHGTIGSEKILLHNAAGDDDESIKINSVAGGITIFSGSTMFLDADNLTIGNEADVPVEIDATFFDLDASSWIRLDGTEVSIDGTLDSNITVDGSNKDLTLSVVGGSTQTLTISSAGTGTNAIDINATGGGIDVDAAAAVDILAATTLSAKGATGASFGDDTGTWEFNGSGAVTETGMTSCSVTPSGAITLTAGAASTWSTSAGALTITSAAAATWSTAAGNLTVDSAAGVLVLDGHTGITLDASNSGDIEINVTAADDILIGNDAVAQDVLLGNAAATQVDLTAILVDINGGSSGVTIDGAAASNFTTSAGAITIDAEASTVTVDGHTGVTVQSSNSGDILLDSAADVVLDAAGGNFEFKDAGTTQLTIDVDGTAGDIDINLNVNGDDLVFNQFDGTEVMRITDTARVGIGDATPESLLHIKGADPVLTIQDTETSAGSANARIRLAETDGSGDAENYWDIHHSGVNFLLTRNDGTGNVVIRSCYVTDFAINIKAEAGGRHYTSSIADFEQNYSMVAEHFVSTAHNPDYGDV